MKSLGLLLVVCPADLNFPVLALKGNHGVVFLGELPFRPLDRNHLVREGDLNALGNLDRYLSYTRHLPFPLPDGTDNLAADFLLGGLSSGRNTL